MKFPGAWCWSTVGKLVVLMGALATAARSAELTFPAQSRRIAEHGIEVVATPVRWESAQTALIVCNFWDSHNCGSAVERVNAMAPRVAEVVAAARMAGMFIIHAPSDCMVGYEGHAARRRAQESPASAQHA